MANLAALNLSTCRRVRFELPPRSRGAWVTRSLCAVADIAAGGIRWGELRLTFDVHAVEFESPMRFAKFFAQQIANMLHRLALQTQNRVLYQRLTQQHRRLQTRKLVQRASSILARMHGIPQPNALELLIHHSRKKRCNLYQVSEGIVLLEWR